MVQKILAGFSDFFAFLIQLKTAGLTRTPSCPDGKSGALQKPQTKGRPIIRVRIAKGLDWGSYCLSAGMCRVCSSMYWPDMTACGTWSEKHTQTEPAANGMVTCSAVS